MRCRALEAARAVALFGGFVAYLAVDRADDAGLAKTAFRACALSRLLLADRLSALASLGLLPKASRLAGLRGVASGVGFPDRPFLRATALRARKAWRPVRLETLAARAGCFGRRG